MKVLALFLSAASLAPPRTAAFLPADGRGAPVSRDASPSRVPRGARSGRALLPRVASVARRARTAAGTNTTRADCRADGAEDTEARGIRLRATGGDATALLPSPLRQQNAHLREFVRERTASTRRKRNGRAAEKINDRAARMTLLPDTKNLVIVPQAHKSAAAEEGAPQGSAAEKNFFVDIFRGSAAYIASHRDSTMVFHIPAELLEWEGFGGLVDDLALAWLLGIKLVIVVGCRSLVDRQLEALGIAAKVSDGRRVTDRDTLEVVKMQAGYARFEVERMLARALSHGCSRNDASGCVFEKANVVSGNFYTAQPVGVLDGTDFEYSGILRRVDTDKVHQAHSNSDVVLLTNLGVSPSGEHFNMISESLAADVAGSIQASKIFYFTSEDIVLRDSTDRAVPSLQLSEAREMLRHRQYALEQHRFRSGHGQDLAPIERETVEKIGWSVAALEKGVPRAHLVCPRDGSLLQELYTRDGAGLLIGRDLYEDFRPADAADVPEIYGLMRPLCDAGVLGRRTRGMIERDIGSYHVYTRDEEILTVGQLHFMEGDSAEICCIAQSQECTDPRKRNAMLGYLERLCVNNGADTIFVLSTQTMQWFREKGFYPAGIDALPPSRRRVYDYSRNSKIYVKGIDGPKDLEAQEQLWDR